MWVFLSKTKVLLHLTASTQGIVSGCLCVTAQRTSPSATWQESRCDLSWTNDGAKRTSSVTPRGSNPGEFDSRCQIIQIGAVVVSHFCNVVGFLFFLYLETCFVMGNLKWGPLIEIIELSFFLWFCCLSVLTVIFTFCVKNTLLFHFL